MRHRVRSRKLGRTSAHRAALYRNMVTSLLDHERIQTTDAKAKEVRRLADRMITLGKRGTLHARRRALRLIRRREVAAKVFDELAERYRDRPGGYTRVLKLGVRAGDAAPISIVELVEAGKVAEPKAGKRAKKATRRKAESEKAPAKKAAPKKKTARKAKTEKASAGKKAASSKKAASKRASSKTTGSKKAVSKKAPSRKTATKKSRKKSD
ncbi:MAG: 50S ribosomal protein L17 [Myxococcales bacterium]|nr:50S ribosomal protein L17 [Myxococcales bacterium]